MEQCQYPPSRMQSRLHVAWNQYNSQSISSDVSMVSTPISSSQSISSEISIGSYWKKVVEDDTPHEVPLVWEEEKLKLIVENIFVDNFQSWFSNVSFGTELICLQHNKKCSFQFYEKINAKNEVVDCFPISIFASTRKQETTRTVLLLYPKPSSF